MAQINPLMTTSEEQFIVGESDFSCFEQYAYRLEGCAILFCRNGEAEVIKVTLKPKEKLKKLIFEKDFSEIAIKGRISRGNILTKNEVYRIGLKQHGGSTLGGRKVWFDHDVHRLNYDEHGEFLGEFQNNDLILVILDNGEFYTTNFDVNNHYEHNILKIEKFKAHKVWTAVLYDGEQGGKPYIKRFMFEPSARKQSYLNENPETKLILLTCTAYPRLEVKLGEPDTFRGPLEIDAEQFIGVKGFKAKGKRLTQYVVESVEELEPVRFPDPEDEEDGDDEDNDNMPEVVDPDEGKSESDIRDELTGQMKLF